MKRSTILFLAVFVTAVTSVGAVDIDSNAGTRGLKFLQVYSSARDASLAGATVSNLVPQTSLASNPAGLATVDRFNANGTHAEWLGAIRQEYADVVMPAWGGGVSIALRTQSSGDIPLRSVPGDGGYVGVPSPNPSGTYGVNDGAVAVGYGMYRTGIHWGASVKYVWEKIYLNSVTAWAIDFGAVWKRGDLSVGGAVRNIGLSNELKSERIDLPWDAQVGASYDQKFGETVLRGMVDFRYAPDWHESVHTGVELDLNRMLVLRTGYRTAIGAQTDIDGFSYGVGLAYGPIGIDYAYIPTDTGFGSEHLFTVRVTP
jgi:hypothetical protein